MIIKTDILSYKIRRQHVLSSHMVSKAMERLSTGLRVNSSSDDSAGLAVSTRLTSLAIANQVGTSNVKDSLNLFHTIDNSLSSTEAMLQRIKELIIQFKNGTLSPSDKQAIQEEVNQITAGIEQTSKTTTFNSKPIINNSLLKFNGVDSYIDIGTPFQDLMTSSHSFEVTFTPAGESPPSREVVFGIQGWHHGIEVLPDKSLLFETWFRNSSGVLNSTRQKTEAGFVKNNHTYQVVGTLDVENKQIRLFVNGKEIGSPVSFPANSALYDYLDSGDGSLRFGMGNNPGINYDYPYKGTIESASIYSKALTDAEIQSNYTDVKNTDNLEGEWIASDGNNSIQYDSIGSHNGKPLGVNYINDKLKVRSGGSSLDTTEFELTNVSAKSLNLYSLSIDDPEAPQEVDQALEKVLNEHTKIGSIINRLNFRVDKLHIFEESVMDSRSRILDTDVVYESSLLTKEQLKQETSLSMLLKNQLKQQSTLNLLQEA